MIGEVIGTYPNVQVVATTLRRATTANRNDWWAIAYADGAFHHATTRTDLEIFDRVGGGDGFASGLIYGLLAGKPVAAGGRVRCRPRCAGDDDARRHVDGHARRGRGGDAGAHGARRAIGE